MSNEKKPCRGAVRIVRDPLGQAIHLDEFDRVVCWEMGGRVFIQDDPEKRPKWTVRGAEFGEEEPS